jgi:hypothetical protein
MTETKAFYGIQDNDNKGLGTINKYDDGSWSIDYSESEKCLYVRATDYHSGPLKLSLEQIAAMVLIGEAKNDVEDPVVSINKKEKKLCVAISKGWSGLLTISRKDLYRFGKQMSKRSNLHRQKAG